MGSVLRIFLVFCFVCFVFFLIVLCLVCSVAYVYGLSSLVCDRSVSCAQCCLCLWIVQSCLWPLIILYRVFPMSMDCPVLFVIVLYLVPSVPNVYGLSSLVCNRSVSNSISSSCICCVGHYCRILYDINSSLDNGCIEQHYVYPHNRSIFTIFQFVKI